MAYQFRQQRVRLRKVTSRIERRAFLGQKLYVILHDTPLELWYGPCSKKDYLKICHELSAASYWEWEYDIRTYELYNWVSADWTCVIQ